MLGSSVDPTKLSLTVKSVGLALVPVIVGVARAFDFEIAENDLVGLVTAVSTIVACVGFIIGMTRKYYGTKNR